MPQRTHTCGGLRKADAGREVVLEGWVAHRRDHGGVIFIDLRDRYGLTQAVFRPDANEEVHKLANTLRSEYVARVRGVVAPRLAGAENPKLPTGEIEVNATALEVLNTSEPPPFDLGEFDTDVGENVRLAYRYLDLRRSRMQRNIVMRHRMWKEIRDFYDEEGFLEIETPFLTKSTPEGARDFLVPSRLQHGRFYALPQSPQLFKQILMVAGCDRYFQIVRCFRDEDTRANRALEFTQLDVEMSFASEDDVLDNTERLVKRLFRKMIDVDVEIPLPRMCYAEAMGRFGSDKPDLRFGMELVNATDLAAESDFNVFKSVATGGGQVIGLTAPGGSKFTRREIDELTALAAEHGAKGLAWFRAEGSGLNSPIAKFFGQTLQAKLRERAGASNGDLLLFVADKPEVAAVAMGQLRLEIARRLNLIDRSAWKLLWVVQFPLFYWNEQEKRCDSAHHPFTAPRPEDEPLLDTEPLKVGSRAYDLVLNGEEIAGGSIRIHRSDVQQKIFDLLSISKEEAEQRFGFFLRALRFGAPPHGGIAWGLERMLMMFLGEQSLRDVIPFPKTQRGLCPLTEAPAPVDAKQLRELGIKLSED
jgi:aspartyl-tRNA synthetase